MFSGETRSKLQMVPVHDESAQHAQLTDDLSPSHLPALPSSLSEAEECPCKIGFPVMIKASEGCGGKGIQPGGERVQHPVTELNTGRDLVAMQIELALETLSSFPQHDIIHQGHAIECRIYAENPTKNFMPSPGRLKTFEWSDKEVGVRIDSGFRSGDEITFFYDPMIAKVICHANNRDDAIDKMVRTLDAIRLEGLTCNIPFLKQTLHHDEFRKGNVFTGFIDVYKSDLVS